MRRTDAPRCTACQRRIRYTRPVKVSGLPYGRTCGQRLKDALRTRLAKNRISGPARHVRKGATILATQSGRLHKVHVHQITRQDRDGTVHASVTRLGIAPTGIPTAAPKPAPARGGLRLVVNRPAPRPAGPGAGTCAECGRYARVRFDVLDIHGIPGHCCARCARDDQETRSFA